MNITSGLCSDLVRLCRRVPTWVATGISGAEGDGAGTGDGNSAGTGAEPTARERALQEEKDRHFQAAKKAKDDLATATTTLAEVQARLKEIEDKDKSESEKAKSEAEVALKAKEAADTKLAEAQATNDKLQVQIAFLANSKYVWHDAGVALQLVAGFGEIEVKDGDVKGLEKAIDKMAKDKPFLVKSGGTDSGNGSAASGQQPNGASTRPTTGGGMTAEERAKLATKYTIPR